MLLSGASAMSVIFPGRLCACSRRNSMASGAGEVSVAPSAHFFWVKGTGLVVAGPWATTTSWRPSVARSRRTRSVRVRGSPQAVVTPITSRRGSWSAMASAKASSMSSPTSVSMITGTEVTAAAGAAAGAGDCTATPDSSASESRAIPRIRAPCRARLRQVDEARDANRREQIDQPIAWPRLSAHQLEDRMARTAECEAVGDRIRERNDDHGEERRYGFGGIRPVDFRQRAHHERSHQDQCWRRGRGGNGLHQGCEEQRREEEDPDHDARETGTATHGDTRGALNIARDRAGPDNGTEEHCDGVRQQNPVQTRDGAVRCDEAGPLGDRHQRADVVEHVDKQEHEHDLDEREPHAGLPVEGLVHVELECRG